MKPKMKVNSKYFKKKEKNQITRIANDFVYDQQIVDSLNENFRKIEDVFLDNLFKVLEGEMEGESQNSTEEAPQKTPACFKYNQSSFYSLELQSDENASKINKALK